MIHPASRDAALAQLADFVPRAVLYARDRNHVVPGHPAVSRLSPAIRHRLLSEDEVAAAVLAVHSPGRVEKFVQEVYWRRYWKSWLSLRPEVWRDYLAALRTLPDSPAVRRVEAGESGNAVIDHFARELVATGYLHNHARMWFAAWWVHEARLPWQAGADFFFRHLLDGDPASNTLSWRWVAGLQTPGKTYLARRSNLEKYLAPELLAALANGLPDFEQPQSHLPEIPARVPITRSDLPAAEPDPAAASGLWIHDEDLSPETSPLATRDFAALFVGDDPAVRDAFHFPAAKRAWLDAALADAADRAGRHWQAPLTRADGDDLARSLVGWAQAAGLDQIITLRPEVGPLGDALPRLSAALATAGIRLALVDRPQDLALRPLATAGFFQFRERMLKRAKAG
jgi:deoxyribodipyrimidine photo-lyase